MDNGWALSLLQPMITEFDKSIVGFPSIKRVRGELPTIRFRLFRMRRTSQPGLTKPQRTQGRMEDCPQFGYDAKMLSWFSQFKRARPKAASDVCKKCGSPSLKRRKATHPVHLCRFRRRRTPIPMNPDASLIVEPVGLWARPALSNTPQNQQDRALSTSPQAGPKKRIDVYRVELDQCRKCGHLMPTPEGRAKVKR